MTRDVWVQRVLATLTAMSVLTTLGIIAMLLVESAGFFGQVPPQRLFFETEWRPLLAPASFGVWPLVLGSFLVTALASFLAFPLGLLAAIYLAELAPRSARIVLKPMIELLGGVPSVVLGYVALRHFTPALQQVLPELGPFNALSASLALALMMLPTFVTLCDDALVSVPAGLREASYALGASRLRALFSTVLPAARSGVSAAVLLSLSRAVGETMIVAIACGATPLLTLDPRQPVQTITAFMVQLAMGDVTFGVLEHRLVFALGLLLFGVTCALNIAAHRLGLRR